MKKSILSLFAFLMSCSGLLALDLTDLNADMAFPAAKNVINANNALLEAETTAPTANTQTNNNLAVKTNATVGANLTVSGTGVVDTITARTGLWADAPVVASPSTYFDFFEDFYTITAYTNAETMDAFIDWRYVGDSGDNVDLLIGEELGGVLTLLTGATDNNESCLQWGRLRTEGLVCITSNSGKRVWFEARVKAPAPGLEGGFFVGLGQTNSATVNFLVDDSGLCDTNKSWIGFWIGTTSSNAWWNFVCNKADAAAIVQDVYIVTNTAATYLNLGFTFNGTNKTTIFVNDVAKTRVHTNNAVSYPNAVMMSPVICEKTGDSYSATGKVDFIKVKGIR